MEIKLLVLAKSDKNNGYCVVGVNRFGKFIRLVKNSEGHALAKERCNFNKMDFLTVDAIPAPLVQQKENYVLGKIIDYTKSNVQTEDLQKYTQNPEFIFLNTTPWLTEEEINSQNISFLFIEVTDLFIYENEEGKYKCDFIYNNSSYKSFSITDPKFKLRNRKISKSFIAVSLPEIPYKKYGNDLYYKFVCAVYPLKNSTKSYDVDCYKI
ncbi:MAG: hypothetical protein IJI84_04265 [Clostridia bacterium]|nr:hypothetical protein [Clostridia bacterium]